MKIKISQYSSKYSC